MLWRISVALKESIPDPAGAALLADAHDLGTSGIRSIRVETVFLLECDLRREQVERIADMLLADPVTEVFRVSPSAEAVVDGPGSTCVHVFRKIGVMDPVEASLLKGIRDLGLAARRARTGRRLVVKPRVPVSALESFVKKAVANEVVDEFFFGPFALEHLAEGRPHRFERVELPFLGATDEQMENMSRRYVLSLNVEELRTVQNYFRTLGRNPTDVEVETIAQTWSEHCKHKTLTGIIDYDGREVDNLLKSTVMRVTRELAKPWCISVFKDNAGIIEFDEKHAVCFKVETHNHPSAIEPYGGAGTGVGGVIRDVLGCGLGAKPVLNTDIFCFAPPDFPTEALPKGVLHPKRVLKGVVSGVRDYGNRMGIPTANGAVYFEDRYLANPLVYVGTIGIMPRDKCFKGAQPGDIVVVAGGRTGRDGIHGATFSSVELTTESEVVSGGAVQIGNAIAEKKVTDTLLQARDLGLYTAVTDCGAGGLSSAVGEMGAELGAELELEKVPLKYEGLSAVEIWISEAQERMVFSVPPDKLDRLLQLFRNEDVEATAIGRFTSDKKLVLRYDGSEICRLDMDFLHDGVPRFRANASWKQPVQAAPAPTCDVERSASPPVRGDLGGFPVKSAGLGEKSPLAPLYKMGEYQVPSENNSAVIPCAHRTAFPETPEVRRLDDLLLKVLASWDVCSKEWIIRQYDHEVQGGSSLKPLVGARNDGPGDACVLRPLLGSNKGIAVSCGMNPHYGDFDPYLMAAAAIDEAVRNIVAVGGDVSHTALLDNFCWGDTRRPEGLGALVRAAQACYDVAKAFGTPFISGKDSLNNEFRVRQEGRSEKVISIPPSLLISAVSIVDDVRRCVSMDLKSSGDMLYIVGMTRCELGGSQFSLATQGARSDFRDAGVSAEASSRSTGTASRAPAPAEPALVASVDCTDAPSMDAPAALAAFRALGSAIQAGLVRACHDLSEGGLAAAAAEMAFSGEVGVELSLHRVPTASIGMSDVAVLFSESNSRFLVEVERRHAEAFESALRPCVCACIGTTIAERVMRVNGLAGGVVIDLGLADLKEAWQGPMRW